MHVRAPLGSFSHQALLLLSSLHLHSASLSHPHLRKFDTTLRTIRSTSWIKTNQKIVTILGQAVSLFSSFNSSSVYSTQPLILDSDRVQSCTQDRKIQAKLLPQQPHPCSTSFPPYPKSRRLSLSLLPFRIRQRSSRQLPTLSLSSYQHPEFDGESGKDTSSGNRTGLGSCSTTSGQEEAHEEWIARGTIEG